MFDKSCYSSSVKKDDLHKALTHMLFDESKLKITLDALADKYNEKIRRTILRTYQDTSLHMLYEGIRSSGDFEMGGKSKVHREIIRFPSTDVYEFLNTVMGALYGPDWLDDKKALNHELVKPWWIVRKI